ncbi:hypothetical protein ACJJTC_000401 [Scirpophaga incertulas]
MPPKNTKAIEERRRAQRLCKKRKYLEIKNDPELLAIEQEKRRNKYKKRKEEGKVKQIKELTPRGQREQRKKWKENSKKYRLIKKQEQTTRPTFEPVVIQGANGAIDTIEEQTNTADLRDPLRYQSSPAMKAVKITWNYSEAGHGKGAPDGIGAVIKRTADRMILFGKDIGTYDQFCDTLMQTIDNVTIKMVDEQEILFKERLIPSNLKPFKGTFSVYQVLWDITVPKTVLRQLSCFDCKVDENCIHGYDLGYLPNNSYGHIENIDPNYVAPLSKSVNRNRNTVEQNPNKQIVVLSDITIGQNIL